MKKIILVIVAVSTNFYSQVKIEHLGLKDMSITSLRINYSITAVGTNGNGVYWKGYGKPDSVEWNHIPLEGKNIRTVYPHKSGPLGWAIGAGIRPEMGDSDFVYCSFLGEDFKPISSGIDTESTYEISDLDGFPDPTICGETFAAGGRKLYRRFFGDTVWHSVYDLSIEGNVRVVKAKEMYPTVIAGGGEGFANHFLVKSYDNGDTWSDISAVIYVHSLDFSDDSAKTIYVTDQYKILKSSDSGASWNEVFNTKYEFMINKILYSENQELVIAVGTDQWENGRSVIYAAVGKKEEWIKIDFDVNSPIVDIAEWYDGGFYIATRDSGIYKISNLITDVETRQRNIPASLTLFQNFPNPFNPATIIRYTIPELTHPRQNAGQASIPSREGMERSDRGVSVRLVVYDILGKEVSVLVNENQKPGNYEVTFEAKDLSSGIYFYTIKSGINMLVGKMNLIK